MHGNDKFNLESSRMKLTNGDCARIKVDTSDGLEPKLAVFGFNKSDNGVCKVNSQIEIVDVSVASALSNGVAVLDLSSCEKLSKVSLSGNFSEKFSVIFPSRHAKSLDISLDLSGSELNLVNFAEFTKGSEFGLLCLEYIQLTGDFPKKIKCSSRVRLTNILGLPSSLSVEGCAADSWFCDLFDVTKISVTCPYTIPFFGSLNSLTELSIEENDTFSPYWLSSKFSSLRNLRVVRIKCREFLGVSHYGDSYEVLSANFSSDKLERLEALGINVYRGSSYIIWESMRSRNFLASKDEIIKCISPDNLYYLSKVYSLIDKYGEVPLRTRRVSDAFRRDINNVKAYREQYNKEVSEYRRTGALLSEEALRQEYYAMRLFEQFDYIAEDKL